MSGSGWATRGPCTRGRGSPAGSARCRPSAIPCSVGRPSTACPSTCASSRTSGRRCRWLRWSDRGLDDYGSLSASILGRAHARSADPALIAGYCGRGTALDEAIARFALSYAGQIEKDHAAVVAAVRGRDPAGRPGPDPLPDHALLGWPDLTVSVR